jgi:signal transduction histidine kinase
MQQKSTCQKLVSHEAGSPFGLVASTGDGVLVHEAGNLSDQAVANLAHELRTSLAVVTLLSGNLDLLYERLDDDRRRRIIRDIRKHTQTLNDLIGDVLALCNDRGPLPI